MWFLLAIGASILWGLTYVLNEKVLHHISIATSFGLSFLSGAIVFLSVALFSGTFHKDMATLATSKNILYFFLASTVIFIFAELCIGSSIKASNATLAGLIEISYPFFIILFSYLLFKESHLNTATIVGGILIFAGIVMIVLFNK